MIRNFALAVALALLPSAAFAQATISVANDPTTGTVIAAPAKYTGANPDVVIVTSGGETAGVQGIVVSWGSTGAATATATTGFATVARLGQPYCHFDASGVTSGNWVINSATGGRCADSGIASTSARPTGKDVFGVAMGTVTANGYGQVDMQLSYLNAGGVGGTPGGSGNSIQYNNGGAFGGIGPLTNGQLLIGSTGAAPVAAALTAGSNITLTPGPGTLTIASAGGSGVTWPATSDLVISNSTNSPAGLAPVNGDCVVGSAGAWIAGSCGGGGGSLGPPQGRITLISNTPVMNADATAATTIYYAPYVGGNAPINGAMTAFSQVSLALDTTNTVSGKLYDVFLVSDSGTIRICYGPAWSSGTSRGTGAGTTQVSLNNGVWVNTVSITNCRYASGSTVGTVAANAGTLVGTFYATANGQTAMQFLPASVSGGSNPYRGISNSYNPVRAMTINYDNNVWTVAGTAYGAMHASNSERVNVVDSLGQYAIRDVIETDSNTTANGYYVWGMCQNSTTCTPPYTGLYTSGVGTSANRITATAHGEFMPAIGFNYYQGVEQYVSAAGQVNSAKIIVDADY